MIGLGSTQQYSQASSLLNRSESVSESVSQWVTDKHNQWSDSGPIKKISFHLKIMAVRCVTQFWDQLLFLWPRSQSQRRKRWRHKKTDSTFNPFLLHPVLRIYLRTKRSFVCIPFILPLSFIKHLNSGADKLQLRPERSPRLVQEGV